MVAVPAIGTLKDLGYYIDTDLGGEAQFKVTLQRLTTALEAMKHKFRGTKARKYAVNSVLMARIAYTGQGANLTKAQIQKLDSVALEYARKELRLLPGFPGGHVSPPPHQLPTPQYGLPRSQAGQSMEKFRKGW